MQHTGSGTRRWATHLGNSIWNACDRKWDGPVPLVKMMKSSIHKFLCTWMSDRQGQRECNGHQWQQCSICNKSMRMKKYGGSWQRKLPNTRFQFFCRKFLKTMKQTRTHNECILTIISSPIIVSILFKNSTWSTVWVQVSYQREGIQPSTRGSCRDRRHLQPWHAENRKCSWNLQVSSAWLEQLFWRWDWCGSRRWLLQPEMGMMDCKKMIGI